MFPYCPEFRFQYRIQVGITVNMKDECPHYERFHLENFKKFLFFVIFSIKQRF